MRENDDKMHSQKIMSVKKMKRIGQALTRERGGGITGFLTSCQPYRVTSG